MDTGKTNATRPSNMSNTTMPKMPMDVLKLEKVNKKKALRHDFS
jgi:hypothetical protein